MTQHIIHGILYDINDKGVVERSQNGLFIGKSIFLVISLAYNRCTSCSMPLDNPAQKCHAECHKSKYKQFISKI